MILIELDDYYEFDHTLFQSDVELDGQIQSMIEDFIEEEGDDELCLEDIYLAMLEGKSYPEVVRIKELYQAMKLVSFIKASIHVFPNITRKTKVRLKSKKYELKTNPINFWSKSVRDGVLLFIEWYNLSACCSVDNDETVKTKFKNFITDLDSLLRASFL